MRRLWAWLRHRRSPSLEVRQVRATRAELAGLVCAAREEADAIMAVVDTTKGTAHRG